MNVTLLTFLRCVLEQTVCTLQVLPVENVPVKEDPSLLVTLIVQFFPLLTRLASRVGPPPVSGSVGVATCDLLEAALSSSVTDIVTE